jgi:hypothetical protein
MRSIVAKPSGLGYQWVSPSSLAECLFGANGAHVNQGTPPSADGGSEINVCARRSDDTTAARDWARTGLYRIARARACSRDSTPEGSGMAAVGSAPRSSAAEARFTDASDRALSSGPRALAAGSASARAMRAASSGWSRTRGDWAHPVTTAAARARAPGPGTRVDVTAVVRRGDLRTGLHSEPGDLAGVAAFPDNRTFLVSSLPGRLPARTP